VEREEKKVEGDDEPEGGGNSHNNDTEGQTAPICVAHPRKIKTNFSSSISGLHVRVTERM
jgi:hypothetical protein